MKYLVIASLALASPCSAQSFGFVSSAQTFGSGPTTNDFISAGTPVDPSNTYVKVLVPNSQGGFVALGDVLGSAKNSAAAIAANRADKDAAVASSMTILPPNPGDRFSLNLSGATIGGHSAGSASGSYRVTGRALAFAGVSRGEDRTLAKGGMSFSFK